LHFKFVTFQISLILSLFLRHIMIVCV
jgi:hypothetical protein